MLFRTSTPKKRTGISLPRSSTPNQMQTKTLRDQQFGVSFHHQIKLDLLLYRPKTESYRRSSDMQQIWDI